MQGIHKNAWKELLETRVLVCFFSQDEWCGSFWWESILQKTPYLENLGVEGGGGLPLLTLQRLPRLALSPEPSAGRCWPASPLGPGPTARLKPRRAVGTPGPGGVTSAGSETSPLSPLPSTLKTHFKLHKIAGDAGPAANTREWTGRSRGCR